MTPSEMAIRLWTARETRTPISSLASQFGDIDLDRAYQVQAVLLEMMIAKGGTLCGYKMGLTSKSKQEDVKVFEPIRGFLLKSFECESGAPIDTKSRIHPRVEPEIAVVLKSELYGPVSVREVAESVAWVGPSLEILDSRYTNFSFSFSDVIADNTSASGFLLGSSNWRDRLSDLLLYGVVVKKNGILVESGAPAAVLGDPLRSVAELVKKVRVLPGMVILTGGITASVSFAAGDVIETVWPGETLTFKAE